MTARILVADSIAPEGLALLEEIGRVELRTGLAPAALADAVADVDALVVRSETKVTRDVLEAARRLRVVGRAGVGVDNIDVEAATERGIVVVNAPAGNTISAAELTVALLLALARNVVPAATALAGGTWNRSRYVGVELRGKTVGLVGLGQVGSAVARRLRAMEMELLGYDPFVPPEQARRFGVELVPLETLLGRADFLSLHCALTEETRDLLDRETLRRVKRGIRIVNTARGGLVDEEALLEALEDGRVAGAALDVFRREPPGPSPLLAHPRVVATPHLGASTVEAQERVALDVARQIRLVLEGAPATTAVNAPFVDPDSLEVIGPYLVVAQTCGTAATQLAEQSWREIAIDYRGVLAEHETAPLRAAAVAGVLATISEERVNLVSLPHVLSRRGWRVTETKSGEAGPYTSLLTVRLVGPGRPVRVSGTLVHGVPHIVEIDGFEVDVASGTLTKGEGHVLIVQNEDRPGRVGAVGTALGAMNVNIAHMAVGRREGGEAIMVLSIDRALSSAEMERLGAIPGIDRVVQIRI